jgi:murein DD-endopeptidase MepM/ murein hydrolase activator NlpD
VTDAKLRAEVDKSLFKGSVTLDRIELPFALAAGKFRATDLHGGNEDLSFGGEADLAIDPATIDANLALTYAAGDNALAGADPTIALHWKGALSSPERRIDLTAMTGFLSLRKFEQERRRVEILQQNIAEKQRLRREAALYRARNAERQRLKLEAEAAEKARQEAEALKRQQELEAKDPAAPAANQDSIDPGIEKPPLEQPAQ